MGQVIRGKWRIDALLGVGGSAAVYSATHRNGKRGALKILYPELTSQPELVTRFLREGYVANRIGHPGAVEILDDDQTEDGTVYLVMELLEGYTLERRLKKHGPLPVLEALRFGDELLDVLEAAHAAGIVHRDVKPANLFITTKDGRLKVLDFGIARLTDPLTPQGSTQLGQPLGTPAFMPPEQARGRWNEVDARTDVWAVGATLTALVTGRRPRHAETSNEELAMAMRDPLPPIATVVPSISSEAATVIDRAVAMDRAERFPSAKAMRQALRLAILIEESGDSADEQPADSLKIGTPQLIELSTPETPHPTGPHPLSASRYDALGVRYPQSGSSGHTPSGPIGAPNGASASSAAQFPHPPVADDGPPSTGGFGAYTGRTTTGRPIVLEGAPPRPPPKKRAGWGRRVLVAFTLATLLSGAGFAAYRFDVGGIGEKAPLPPALARWVEPPPTVDEPEPPRAAKAPEPKATPEAPAEPTAYGAPADRASSDAGAVPSHSGKNPAKASPAEGASTPDSTTEKTKRAAKSKKSEAKGDRDTDSDPSSSVDAGAH